MFHMTKQTGDESALGSCKTQKCTLNIYIESFPPLYMCDFHSPCARSDRLIEYLFVHT